MLNRLISFEVAANKSFFLWGQRQTGKTSLMVDRFRNSTRIDLLKSDEFAKYVRNPHLLRSEIAASKPTTHVVIDEVQKVPVLLDEVHWLIENLRTRFVLCGSSARKLKRGHANLLGGRALRFELFGLVTRELPAQFSLTRLLNAGYLPPHVLSDIYPELLHSYVSDYLKEEVAEEGLVRSLPTFARFLDLAALSDTEIVSYSTFARDCGVSSNTIQQYYQILVDTLIGDFLPAFVKRIKRRTVLSPKFYFRDVGVVNSLAKRGLIEEGSSNYGKAFENWVHHELHAYSTYRRLFFDLSYWRPSPRTEVDFLINDMEIAIEAKSTDRITSDHYSGLRLLKEDYPKVKKRAIVCREPIPRITEDGIEVLPAEVFSERLWDGQIV